jgi:hypothetical protein
MDENSSYSLNDTELETVSNIRDLGIIVSQDLKPHLHIVKIVSQASVRACLIYRAFITRRHGFLLNMYKVFVRPIVESNTSLWSPCQLGDTKLVEKFSGGLQRHSRALRRCHMNNAWTCLGWKLWKFAV